MGLSCVIKSGLFSLSVISVFSVATFAREGMGSSSTRKLESSLNRDLLGQMGRLPTRPEASVNLAQAIQSQIGQLNRAQIDHLIEVVTQNGVPSLGDLIRITAQQQ